MQVEETEDKSSCSSEEFFEVRGLIYNVETSFEMHIAIIIT